jgi:hypothetical protein
MSESGERRYKFLGRHLMVKGEYVDDILKGRKRATIRLGLVTFSLVLTTKMVLLLLCIKTNNALTI